MIKIMIELGTKLDVPPALKCKSLRVLELNHEEWRCKIQCELNGCHYLIEVDRMKVDATPQ